jgi:glycosyltransferase involved in cell wall biosynthesis
MEGAMSNARQRVAAIVPAFNEGGTIAQVLETLQRSAVDEVLVVSDGSTDETVANARARGAKTIHHKRNYGKGEAMATGLLHTDAPLVLFVDGDILNLTPEMVAELVEPVRAGRVEMNIGIRHRGVLLDAWHRRFGPLLSGIRCLRREVFEAVPSEYRAGFRIETALNWACRRLGWRRGCVLLCGLKHHVKERKRGLVPGVRARIDMFATVFRAWLSLQRKPLTPLGGRLPAAVQPEHVVF